MGHIGLKEPPTQRLLGVTPIRLPRFAQTSSGSLALAFLPSSIPPAYLRSAEAHNDGDNSPVPCAARSADVNVSPCVLKDCSSDTEECVSWQDLNIKLSIYLKSVSTSTAESDFCTY